MSNLESKKLFDAYLDYVQLLYMEVNPATGIHGIRIVKMLYALNIEPEYVRLDNNNDLMIPLINGNIIEVEFDGTINYTVIDKEYCGISVLQLEKLLAVWRVI